MSNVTAPLLVGSVLLPVLHEIPQKSRYLRSLLMGLAFSCNIGGMATPIASPQNTIAVSALEHASEGDVTLGFASWIAVAFPFCAAAIIICWLFLMWLYGPIDIGRVEIPEHEHQNAKINKIQIFIILVSLLTIVGWCTLAVTQGFFGDLGIIALLPVVIFFSTGILGKDDLLSFQWHLLLLIGGGTALGEAVSLSNLLAVIASYVTELLGDKSLWVTTLVFVSFVGAVTIFVSHTVASMILMPIIAQYGIQIGHPRLLVLSCTLMCSGSMALPMSSFPNVNSLYMEDDFGMNYLKVVDFIKAGGPMTGILLLLVLTFGYFLMTTMRF